MIDGWTILSLVASLFAIFLSAGTATFFALYTHAQPDLRDLESQLNAQRLDHADLLDKVEHWQRRDAVRKTREKRSEATSEAEHELPQAGAPATKAELRKRWAALRGLPSVSDGAA